MIAIVTGHSRGLGAGIAEALLRREIPVLGVSRGTNPGLAARFSLLREVPLDLADAEAVARWLDGPSIEECAKGRRLALLVNNAGLLRPIGPLELQEPAAVARAVAVNVGAALTLAAAFVQATRDVADRRILHVSSGAGRKAYAGWSVYCATKAALDHHARCIAMDATPRLRIAAVAPGIVDTDMQTEIRESTDDRFPDRPRFVEMKREGRLKSAAMTGADLVELLLSDRFGAEPVTELPR